MKLVVLLVCFSAVAYAEPQGPGLYIPVSLNPQAFNSLMRLQQRRPLYRLPFPTLNGYLGSPTPAFIRNPGSLNSQRVQFPQQAFYYVPASAIRSQRFPLTAEQLFQANSSPIKEENRAFLSEEDEPCEEDSLDSSHVELIED